MARVNVPATWEGITPTVPNGVLSKYIVSLTCILYVVGYAGYCFEFYAGIKILRYVIYTIPLVLTISILAEPTPKINKLAAVCFFSYLALGIAWYLIGTEEADYFSDFTILLLVILCYVPVLNVTSGHIRFIFGCSALFLATDYYLLGGGIRFFQILQGDVNLTSYDSASGGLLPATYTIFFYAIGWRIEFFISLIMALFGGKRIVVLAILVGLFSYYIFKGLNKNFTRVLLLLAALVTIDFIGTQLPYLTEYFKLGHHAGQDIEQLTNGRHAVGDEMARLIEHRSWLEGLFGTGPGGGNGIAALVSAGSLPQPHNDWLKILFDYGVIGSALFNVFIALTFSSSRIGPSIAIANAVVMLTDNVIIYLYYQVPLAIMLAFCTMRESEALETSDASKSSEYEVTAYG